MRWYRHVTVLCVCAFLALAVVGTGLALGPDSIGPIIAGGTSAKAPTLPDSVYVAEGTQLNLWTSQLFGTTPGSEYFRLGAEADSGAAWTSSYRWAPVAGFAPDPVAVTLKALDPSGKSTRTKSVIVQSVENDAGSGAHNVMFVGDSVFAGGQIVSAVYDLIDADGGADVQMVGSITRTSAPDWHVGISGRTWKWFASHADSPFWHNARIDFQEFVADSTYATGVDYVVFQLGYNDIWGWLEREAYSPLTGADLDAITDYTKAMIDTLANATYGYPDAEVIIGLPGFGAGDMSAFGDDYGARSIDTFLKNLRLYQNRMIAEFDAGAYASNVDVCAAGTFVDRKYGYTFSQSAVSSRSDSTVSVYNNFLHPNAEGYAQYGDAFYSHLRQRFYLDGAGAVNLIDDSEDVTNWTAITGSPVQGADILAPDGATDAQMWATAGLEANSFRENLADGELEGPRVLSCYFNGDDAGVSYVGLQFVEGDGDYHYAYFNLATDGTVSLYYSNSGSVEGTDWGYDVQSDWTRIWIYEDCDAGVSQEYVRVYVDWASDHATRDVGVWGVQVEAGASMGAYDKTP